MKRVHHIDTLRGFTIISMIFYHLFYDLVYIFGRDIEFYTIEKVRPWQISIAVSFFIISGISSYLTKGDKLIKKGLIVSLLGLLISLVTYIFIRNELIIFGVLNGLGGSMIICGFLKERLNKINIFWMIVFILLFIIFYNIDAGYLNLFIYKIKVPEFLYRMNLFILGFPKETFRSSDYFPLIPWIFIYLFGYGLGKLLKEKDFFGYYGSKNILSLVGKNSLKIYLLHQLVIYGLLELIF